MAVCSSCGTEAPHTSWTCPACGTPLSGELSTTGMPALAGQDHRLVGVSVTAIGVTGATGDVTGATGATGITVGGTTGNGATAAGHYRRLQAGDQFGKRYHVMKLLGMGGMGAVYQAWDEELGMAVALKVIRPEYADRGGAESERRFKRELVLARQVTHKNVIRIHDLGEVDGTKYISMPFIDGADLATVIKQRGKLPLPEMLQIARQLAAGLSAAHEVGVVHRDLKPANILIGADVALITDFGIAHSLSGPAEGGVVGTLRYMAPEQAQGRPVDHRADIYAVGLILYEMLAGHRWAGHTAIEALTQKHDDEPSAPVVTDALVFGDDVPEPLAAVLRRCLAYERDARYDSAGEILTDLQYIDDEGNALDRPVFYTIPASLPLIGGRTVARGTAAAVLALLLAVPVTSAAGYFISMLNAPVVPVTRDPVSVVVADFENQTGDDTLAGVVEQALGIALEGASFISAMSRVESQRLVDQIDSGARVDTDHARIVAQREGIDIVLAGTLAAEGTGYRLTVNTIDPVPGRVLQTYTVTARNRDGLLGAVGDMASDLRTALGDTTPESARAAERETFTAGSLEAAGLYSQGQELLAASKYEEAIPFYRRATEIDERFGRAFSSWALAASSLGRTEEAEALYKRAFAVSDRMTEREKYRLYGTYYLTVAQAYGQAKDNYTKLVELYPSDQAGHANLAVAYLYMLDLPKAFEHARRALELYPSSQKQRNNYALYAMYASDFPTAAKESQAVLDKDATYFRAYVPKAIAAFESAPDMTAATYREMAPLGPQAASIAEMGLGDLALYQGRSADAVAILRPGVAADMKAGNRAAAAAKHLAIAEAHAAMARQGDALTAVRSALALTSRPSVTLAAARLLIAAGRLDDARPLEAQLAKKLDPHSRVYGRIIQAELYMYDGRTADAVDTLLAAQKMADLWLVHYLLGKAYITAEQYPEALAEFDLCQKRRGEATAIFLDDIPSLRYLSSLGYWHGRAQEGVGLGPQAAASYTGFLALHQNTGGALVDDARKRAAALSR